MILSDSLPYSSSPRAAADADGAGDDMVLYTKRGKVYKGGKGREKERMRWECALAA
jgi:hypothetical protein